MVWRYRDDICWHSTICVYGPADPTAIHRRTLSIAGNYYARCLPLFALLGELIKLFRAHPALDQPSLSYLLENVCLQGSAIGSCPAVVLALVIIYVPLVFQSIRNMSLDRVKETTDLVVVAADYLAICIFLFFLPSGFDSIGQWETWPFQCIFGGQFRQRRFLESELGIVAFG